MLNPAEEFGTLLEHLNAMKPEVMSQAKSYSVAASEVLISLKQLFQGYSEINDELKADSATN
jgi:hypothetical protein